MQIDKKNIYAKKNHQYLFLPVKAIFLLPLTLI